MIERIGAAPNIGLTSNAAPRETEREFNAVFKQTVLHGYVGDGQVLPVPDEETIQMLNEMMSAFDGSYDFWDAVLQLEEKADIKALIESVFADPDNALGRSMIEALLTQLWKKKELSGEDITKYDISAYFKNNHVCSSDLKHADSKAVSELEALILKNKERRIAAAV